MTNHTGYSAKVLILGTPFVAVSWVSGTDGAETWTLYDGINYVDMYMPDSDELRRFDTLSSAREWAEECVAQREEIKARAREFGTLKMDRNGNFELVKTSRRPS